MLLNLMNNLLEKMGLWEKMWSRWEGEMNGLRWELWVKVWWLRRWVFLGEERGNSLGEMVGNLGE